MKTILAVIATSALATGTSASDVDVTVQSGGLGSVVVDAGSAVSYEVIAELSDNDNQGLGLILFDLTFESGDLGQADEPAAGPMTSFANPLGLGPGLTNPDGFGGTVVDGDLIQVGGAQNTIGSTFAPAPSGAIITGVASNGSPQVIVTGTLTAPTAPGSYRLRAANLVVNVVKLGETGTPFWAVESAGVGSVTDLVVTVEQGCQTDLGFGGPGVVTLSVCGDDLQEPDSSALLSLGGAAANAPVFLIVGLANNPTPVLRGTLVPVPVLLVVAALSTDGAGELAFTILGGPNSPVTLYMQALVPNGPVFEFSNALEVRLGLG